VRYGKDLYKAEYEINTAEPGNTSQYRFFVNMVFLFNPRYLRAQFINTF